MYVVWLVIRSKAMRGHLEGSGQVTGCGAAVAALRSREVRIDIFDPWGGKSQEAGLLYLAVLL